MAGKFVQCTTQPCLTFSAAPDIAPSYITAKGKVALVAQNSLHPNNLRPICLLCRGASYLLNHGILLTAARGNGGTFTPDSKHATSNDIMLAMEAAA